MTMLRAEFEDATLTEANLPNSKLVDANLSRADLSRSIFTNSDFTNARLNETNFSGSQLQGVNFSGADLSTSQGLQQAQLDEACGDENTRLPVGLFLSNCEGETSEDTRTTPERLDHAISDIENLLAASSTDDQGLHTRLQRIHNDLVQAKSALMH